MNPRWRRAAGYTSWRTAIAADSTVGVTADLVRRVHQHRHGEGSRHAADYGKTRLVYAERHEGIEPAIAREKLVKKWRREWKFALIEAANPD